MKVLLLVIAVLCFLLAAFGAGIALPMVPLGLACFAGSFLVP